jgi:hypothetical protein
MDKGIPMTADKIITGFITRPEFHMVANNTREKDGD